MKKIFFIWLFFCLLGSKVIYAQEGVLQLDKCFYFAGEYIFYNVFLGSVATDSAYVKIKVKQGDEILAEHFHICSQGHLSGYIKLSHELRSGICDIQAFAYDQTIGDPIYLFSEAVSIFGNVLESAEALSYAQSTGVAENIRIGSAELTFEDVPIARSSHVAANIMSEEMDGDHISVAIRKKVEGSSSLGSIRRFRHDLHQQNCMTHLPLVGNRKLLEADQHRNMLLYSCQPKTLQFQLTQVDSTGRFKMNFSNLFGARKIQFVDYLSLPMEVRFSPLESPIKSDYTLIPDTNIRNEYQTFQERKKIFQLFDQATFQINSMEISELTNPTRPDFDLDIQDYAIRGTITDFFKEISTPLKFQKRKGKDIIRVLYESAGNKYFYSGSPLFIINGIATQDIDFVQGLVLQEIKRIQIYSRLSTLQSLVGGHRSGGVVVIDLVDPLFKLPIESELPGTTISGLQIPIAYPIQHDPNRELPKIQPLVYWSPKNKLDHNGGHRFQFMTSDLAGEYQMDIIVQSTAGEIRVNHHTFMVR